MLKVSGSLQGHVVADPIYAPSGGYNKHLLLLLAAEPCAKTSALRHVEEESRGSHIDADPIYVPSGGYNKPLLLLLKVSLSCRAKIRRIQTDG